MIRGSELSELIYKIRCRCINRDEEIRSHTDLSPAEYRAILMIQPEESISGITLGERLDLSPSRTSRVIDQLIAQGYLSKQTDALNRRLHCLRLTSAGERIHATIITERQSCDEKLEEQLSEQDREEIFKALTKLTMIN